MKYLCLELYKLKRRKVFLTFVLILGVELLFVFSNYGNNENFLGMISDPNAPAWELSLIHIYLNYFASFYPKEQLRDVKELLEELEFKKDFLNKPVSSYSKGMRQRVSMARALISNPKLLFLDEPTSGLDPAGAVLFRKIIEEERQKGTTVFLTTHNMLDADLLCDRVAFITNGNIVALDTPQNLKEKNSNHRIVAVSYTHLFCCRQDFPAGQLQGHCR